MDVDAIDQSICPEVLGMTKCSIAIYCMRPTAECNRTLGHSQHRRTNSLVYCIHTN